MMMGNSGGLMGGVAKIILFIAILVAILSLVAGITASDNLVELPIAQAEAAGMQADIDRQRQQWAMEQPYLEQQLAAENQVAIAESEQERALIEANTAAELARIEAETANFQASLNDQRQMVMAEHQQALVEADRWNQLLTSVLTVIVIVTVGAAAAILVILGYRKVALAPAGQTDPLKNPLERRILIDALRKRDELERAELIRKSRLPIYSNGNEQSQRIQPSAN